MFRIGFSTRDVVRRRRCLPRESERGAALVETAILIPLVILLTFGLIEFSSAYQSSAVATSASRAAARTGSAEALLPTYAIDAATAAATALHTVGANEPQVLWIYKADATTGLPSSGNFTTCSTNCICLLYTSPSPRD